MSTEGSLELPATQLEKAPSSTFGIIMVKPNAVEQTLDLLIRATFDGDVQPVFERPDCDFVEELDKVTLCGSYYRDLSVVPYGDNLINLLYGDKKDFRCFPMISDYYRGRAVFLLLKYAGTQEGFDQFLTSVKGSAETFDERGDLVTAARGIRGALQLPYRHYPRDTIDALTDEEYRVAFLPRVQNFLHVCDTPQETALVMSYLFTAHDFSQLERLGCAVTNFVERHRPKPEVVPSY